MVEFDLKKIKGKKVAVNCVTEEQAQNFVDWVCSFEKNIDLNTGWEEHKQESCYRLSKRLFLGVSNKTSCRDVGFEIISYEEALLKEENNTPNKDQNISTHYKNQGIDTIARCKANMTLQSQKDICIFNVDKYLHREKNQNLSDIKKIRDYLNWLEEIEKSIEK